MIQNCNQIYFRYTRDNYQRSIFEWKEASTKMIQCQIRPQLRLLWVLTANTLRHPHMKRKAGLNITSTDVCTWWSAKQQQLIWMEQCTRYHYLREWFDTELTNLYVDFAEGPGIFATRMPV